MRQKNVRTLDLRKTNPLPRKATAWGGGVSYQSVCPDLIWQRPRGTRYKKSVLDELELKETSLCLVSVNIRSVQSLAEKGLLRPLDEDCPSQTLRSYLPSILDICRHKGKLYGIPEDFSPYILISQKKILSQFGFSPPETWSELEQQLKSLSTKYRGPFVGIPGEGHGAGLGFLLSTLASIGVFTFRTVDDLLQHEKQCLDAYHWIQKLYRSGWLDIEKLDQQGYSTVSDLFDDGQWVYRFCSAHQLKKLSATALKGIRVSRFPVASEAKSNAILVRGHAWVIPANSLKVEDGIRALNRITLLKSAVENECKQSYPFHANRDVWKNARVLECCPMYQMAKLLVKEGQTYLPAVDSDFLRQLLSGFLHSLASNESGQKWLSRIPRNIIQNVSQLVQLAANHINEHLTDIHSIDEICRKLGRSRNYLDKLFKQEMHMSCADYLTRTRMTKAQELLKEPSLSIKEIASRVGILNPKVFSRTFRHYHGTSPMLMRRSQLKSRLSQG